MAWAETCRINANKQIDHLHKQGMSKRQAIKKLSGESGISYNTMNNWYYPRKSDVKNNVTPKNKAKNKKQPSQEEIWFRAGQKLKWLDNYIEGEFQKTCGCK